MNMNTLTGKMKMAFITDGGLNMGMGHVYRTLTLANEIKDVAETCVVTKGDERVVHKLRESGRVVLEANCDHEIINHLIKIRPDVIAVDMLNVEKVFAKKLKTVSNNRLILFENLISGSNRYADVVINAVMGADFKNKKYLDRNTNTLYLYGPKYFAFKEEVYEFKKRRKVLKDRINRILLIFGASDPSDLTSLALRQLLNSDENYKIDIVVGAHFGHEKALNSILTEYVDKKDKVFIYKDVGNVAELMFNADVVVCSPGLSAYVALCIGTPIIVFHHNSWQKEGFKGFIDTMGRNEMFKLKEMVDRGDFVDPRSGFIKEMLIGEGKREVIEAILGE